MKHMYTGIDIIEIARIEESIKKPEFIKKIFTKKEIELCTRKNKAEFYAGRFAAKEAIFKAISQRVGTQKIDWLDIEILSEPNGRPEIVFYNGRN